MKNFCVLVFLVSTSFAISQPLSPIEVSIEMRDTKQIAADVYIPDGGFSRPTILIQTPYNKFFYRYSLPLGIELDLESSPYNFVVIDWRGFYASASANVGSYDRGMDGYDVIDWIVQQDWSDGQVGTWGPSALGKIQFQTARYQHPNHICAVPIVASPEFLYQEYYPNGVYRTEYVEQLDNLGYGLSTTLLANPHYNITWQYIENQNYYPDEIQIPCLMIGGWYDHTTDAMLKYFDAICTESPGEIAQQHRILLGPWAHGGFGATQVGTSTQGELEFPEAADWSNDKANEFFSFYLLGAEIDWLGQNPKYKYFQMGDMEWKGSEVWPPAGLVSKKYYLNDVNMLSETAPVSSDSHSQIVYDPRDPSPTVGSCTLTEELGQGPYDQAPVVESRDDILVFSSEILAESVKHTGNVKVKLFVSSDRLDTDFAIRLCDVYPDDRSMILRDNIFRMRFRDGFTINDTTLMHDGEIYEIEIELANTSHTFLPGHRIRVDISSSDYPRFNNNINDGGEMYVAGDTLIATNTVYHEISHASYVEFQVDNTTHKTNFINSSEISIYPNPALKSDEINICSADQLLSIKIINKLGTVVEIIECVKNNSYKISNLKLNSGFYIIEITTNKGKENKKLIIN
ncbi:MAG: CocE/NonD family hydrolase [Bacteroidales bacterium]|nr:CocE/NonD family hydrolase [Bacteroidales bacterium]